MSTSELLVAAIKNGTVIDHIPAGQALKILSVLKLAEHNKVVTIGLNLPSKMLGHKDLLKVEGRELTPDEVNNVALLAPKATVNIIHNFKVSKKFAIVLPNAIERLVVCPNPVCITNHERMTTRFAVEKGKIIRLKCHYCEKVFAESEVKGYNT